jgi:hypothetical protein
MKKPIAKFIRGSKVRIRKGTVISRIIGDHVVSASLLIDPENVYEVNSNNWGRISVRIPEWNKSITFYEYQLIAA